MVLIGALTANGHFTAAYSDYCCVSTGAGFQYSPNGQNPVKF